MESLDCWSQEATDRCTSPRLTCAALEEWDPLDNVLRFLRHSPSTGCAPLWRQVKGQKIVSQQVSPGAANAAPRLAAVVCGQAQHDVSTSPEQDEHDECGPRDEQTICTAKSCLDLLRATTANTSKCSKAAVPGTDPAQPLQLLAGPLVQTNEDSAASETQRQMSTCHLARLAAVWADSRVCWHFAHVVSAEHIQQLPHRASTRSDAWQALQ